MHRSSAIIAICILFLASVFAACGSDAPTAASSPNDDGGSDATETGVPVPKDPPPISGAFGWYADISPAHTFGNAFAVAPDGRVAIAFSPIEAGTVAGTGFTHYGPGTKVPNYDLLIAVLDNTGKPAWVRTFATQEIEAANAIAFDEAGDVYVSGTFKDNADGLDFGGGVAVGIGPGEISGFLVKLRGSDGGAVWANSVESATAYVKPYCGLSGKDLAVRGGRGFVGCAFDAGQDGTRRMKIGAKAGVTEIPGAGPNGNAVVLGFDPADGRVTSSYVLGGTPTVETRALRIASTGDVVVGGTMSSGTANDSAGSAPLTSTGRSCLVFTLRAADGKPAFRRVFGSPTASCDLHDIGTAGTRVLIAAEAQGDLDLGDAQGPPDAAASFGFFGALDATKGTNLQAFERYPNETVFGIATDAWDQFFVAMATPSGFRYDKRDPSGKVVFTSKTYTAVPDSGAPNFDGEGLQADLRGSLTLVGGFKGAFVFDDGVARGGDGRYRLFTLRFAP